MERYFKDSTLEDKAPRVDNLFIKEFKRGREEFKLICLDTVGQHMGMVDVTSNMMFETRGFILVFSVESKESFEIVKHINEKISDSRGEVYFPRILVGSKCDSKNREVSEQTAKEYAEELKCPYVECSVRENINVNAVFDLVLGEIEKEKFEFFPYDVRDSAAEGSVHYESKCVVLQNLCFMDLVRV